MWQVTCAVNTAKALMPFQESLRAVKRNLINPTTTIAHERALNGGLEHIAAIRQCHGDIKDKDVLEIGTGWHPVIPLLFRAAGARRVYLTDMHRLLHERTVLAAVDLVLESKKKVSASLGVSELQIEKALMPRQDLPLDRLLEEYGFTYIVPFDGKARMPEVDIVFSHTVLEHIPPHLISDLFQNLKTGLRPDGVMSHGIDHSDHRANQDPRLSRIDFLHYSERLWNLLCLNPQDYTNRLRHSDYISIMENCDYKILFEEKYVCPKAVEDASKIPLWGRFRFLEPTDLGTLWSHFVVGRE